MREIGGYFELELPDKVTYPKGENAVYVNSARHAFEYILLRLEDVKRVLLPRYTCEVMLEPLHRLNIPYFFYDITTELTIKDLPELSDGEYIVINNYYGIQDAYVDKVASYYGERAIIDNAQAWYKPSLPGIKAIYSPRKFFGVPDGGVAENVALPGNESETLLTDLSWDRCSHLLKRLELPASEGYRDFNINSDKLSHDTLKEMSALTRRVLANVDFQKACDIRRENFRYIHRALEQVGIKNMLEIPAMKDFACPMVYPLLISNGAELRKKLIAEKVYVATYWPNVFEWAGADSPEYFLAANLLPLPIDQRYDTADMERIVAIISENQ